VEQKISNLEFAVVVEQPRIGVANDFVAIVTHHAASEFGSMRLWA
jgi:hypothetical protein